MTPRNRPRKALSKVVERANLHKICDGCVARGDDSKEKGSPPPRPKQQARRDISTDLISPGGKVERESPAKMKGRGSVCPHSRFAPRSAVGATLVVPAPAEKKDLYFLFCFSWTRRRRREQSIMRSAWRGGGRWFQAVPGPAATCSHPWWSSSSMVFSSGPPHGLSKHSNKPPLHCLRYVVHASAALTYGRAAKQLEGPVSRPIGVLSCGQWSSVPGDSGPKSDYSPCTRRRKEKFWD